GAPPTEPESRIAAPVRRRRVARADPHAASWGVGTGIRDSVPALRELPSLVVKQKRRPGRPRKVLPIDMPLAPAPPIEIALVRDLSTCLLDEIEKRWDAKAKLHAEKALGLKWRELVPTTHQPIYFLAERCWFDNAEAKNDPRFLYAPLHRDAYCRPIANYVTGSVTDLDGL